MCEELKVCIVKDRVNDEGSIRVRLRNKTVNVFRLRSNVFDAAFVSFWSGRENNESFI